MLSFIHVWSAIWGVEHSSKPSYAPIKESRGIIAGCAHCRFERPESHVLFVAKPRDPSLGVQNSRVFYRPIHTFIPYQLFEATGLPSNDHATPWLHSTFSFRHIHQAEALQARNARESWTPIIDKGMDVEHKQQWVPGVEVSSLISKQLRSTSWTKRRKCSLVFAWQRCIYGLYACSHFSIWISQERIHWHFLRLEPRTQYPGVESRPKLCTSHFCNGK